MEVVKRILNQGERTNLHFYRDTKGNEVDLLIPKARQFAAVEIKSGQTFQPGFISGIEHFKNVCEPDRAVNAILWYNGPRKTSYKDTDVSNPLLHGFKW